MRCIEKRMDTIQDFKYEYKNKKIGEEDLNALDEWISINEEKMM